MANGKQLEDLCEALIEKKAVKNKKEFCEAVGINYKHLSRFFRDELSYQINHINYEKLKKCDINIEWFITGQGSMFLNEEPKLNDDELKKKEAEIERLQKELEELKKAVHNLEKDDEELIELTPREIKALKKKVEKLEKLEPEYEELKKTVAELEKDNERLDAEILEKFQRLKNQLNAKGIKFEFT